MVSAPPCHIHYYCHSYQRNIFQYNKMHQSNTISELTHPTNPLILPHHPIPSPKRQPPKCQVPNAKALNNPPRSLKRMNEWMTNPPNHQNPHPALRHSHPSIPYNTVPSFHSPSPDITILINKQAGEHAKTMWRPIYHRITKLGSPPHFLSYPSGWASGDAGLYIHVQRGTVCYGTVCMVW